MMVARIAGTLPRPNSISTGIRYTKLGSVCMMSSTGSRMRRSHALREVKMPSGTPSTTDSMVATSISASVSISLSHRPKQPIA